MISTNFSSIVHFNKIGKMDDFKEFMERVGKLKSVKNADDFEVINQIYKEKNITKGRVRKFTKVYCTKVSKSLLFSKLIKN